MKVELEVKDIKLAVLVQFYGTETLKVELGDVFSFFSLFSQPNESKKLAFPLHFQFHLFSHFIVLSLNIQEDSNIFTTEIFRGRKMYRIIHVQLYIIFVGCLMVFQAAPSMKT